METIPYLRELLFGVVVALAAWAMFGPQKCPCKKELEALKKEIETLKRDR
ncbi:MAG: hypothetical protein AB7E49_11650 [Campylobacterales bacterium]